MEDNHLDKNFQEFFKNRKLTPKNESWNRLDVLMTVNEEKQGRRKTPIYLAAASLLAILSIVFFMNREVIVEESTEFIVKTEEPKDVNNKDENTIQNESLVKDIDEENSSKNAHPEANYLVNNNPKKVAIDSSKEKDLNKNQNEDKSENLKVDLYVQSDESPLFARESEGLDIKEPNRSGLKIDADKLLANVESSRVQVKNTAVEKPEKPGLKLDPSILLAQAENEVSTGFVKKAIKGLQSGSESILVAVANRNHE